VPFGHDLPVDKQIGIIPETLRVTYRVFRSGDPLTSFITYGELAEVLAGAGNDTSGVAPIQRLHDADGDVLLAGVTHTSSTAVHLAEDLAGRRLFLRHALTAQGVKSVLCGGCSDAFDELQPHVEHLERRTTVGNATLRCYRLKPYVEAARRLIERDPYALLCDCERCRSHKMRVPA
jgi:aminoglycoside 3-N-acetyltransferase